jgi:hypothetical protein
MLEGIDFLAIFPYVVGGAAALIFVLVLYVYYFKPKIELPLPNERYEGVITIYLPRLGLMVGPMTTARQTLSRWWNDLITNEEDKDQRQNYEDVRKGMMQRHPFAHKTDAGRKLYLFDENPLSQEFMSVDASGKHQSRLIHHVQDAWSVGEYNGFECVWVKLDASSQPFTANEMLLADQEARCLSFLEEAAKNTRKISALQKLVGYLEKQLGLEQEAKAKMRSERDRAKSALGQKSLSEGEVQLKGAFRQQLKEWFSLPQIATEVAGFLAAPHIIGYISSYTGVIYEYPVSALLVAAITGVGFFIIPIGKKLLGRWL